MGFVRWIVEFSQACETVSICSARLSIQTLSSALSGVRVVLQSVGLSIQTLGFVSWIETPEDEVADRTIQTHALSMQTMGFVGWIEKAKDRSTDFSTRTQGFSTHTTGFSIWSQKASDRGESFSTRSTKPTPAIEKLRVRSTSRPPCCANVSIHLEKARVRIAREAPDSDG